MPKICRDFNPYRDSPHALTRRATLRLPRSPHLPTPLCELTSKKFFSKLCSNVQDQFEIHIKPIKVGKRDFRFLVGVFVSQRKDFGTLKFGQRRVIRIERVTNFFKYLLSILLTLNRQNYNTFYNI